MADINPKVLRGLVLENSLHYNGPKENEEFRSIKKRGKRTFVHQWIKLLDVNNGA